jgi:hypothetical protein
LYFKCGGEEEEGEGERSSMEEEEEEGEDLEASLRRNKSLYIPNAVATKVKIIPNKNPDKKSNIVIVVITVT